MIEPKPPEVFSATAKKRMRELMVVVAVAFASALATLWISPESPLTVKKRDAALAQENNRLRLHITSLQRNLLECNPSTGGLLKAIDRKRHYTIVHKTMRNLQRLGAQAAAELLGWFVDRWNQLLDAPQEDDRIGRRAATLSLLIGGMAANVDPGDYVPWQAEFFAGTWLGDIHFDLDQDGFPAPRTAANPHDGFADVSVCHIAMALNLTIADAKIFMMPELQCDQSAARISVFLQGSTLNDALSHFVSTLREQGFVVVERAQGEMRLILVGLAPIADHDA